MPSLMVFMYGPISTNESGLELNQPSSYLRMARDGNAAGERRGLVVAAGRVFVGRGARDGARDRREGGDRGDREETTRHEGAHAGPSRTA